MLASLVQGRGSVQRVVKEFWLGQCENPCESFSRQRYLRWLRVDRFLAPPSLRRLLRESLALFWSHVSSACLASSPAGFHKKLAWNCVRYGHSHSFPRRDPDPPFFFVHRAFAASCAILCLRSGLSLLLLAVPARLARSLKYSFRIIAFSASVAMGRFYSRCLLRMRALFSAGLACLVPKGENRAAASQRQRRKPAQQQKNNNKSNVVVVVAVVVVSTARTTTTTRAMRLRAKNARPLYARRAPPFSRSSRSQLREKATTLPTAGRKG